MDGDERGRLRAFYARAWQRSEAGAVLEPLEALVATVVGEHREYLPALLDPERRAQDYVVGLGERNPFLHLGMHVALREQSAADRPAGFRAAYERLVASRGDRHDAEHDMMDCLGQVLWEAERRAAPPDEQAFLACVRGLQRPR